MAAILKKPVINFTVSNDSKLERYTLGARDWSMLNHIDSINQADFINLTWLSWLYKGGSLIFVTWPRNFIYGCTGKNQEHISSDTPFLHITP